MTKEEATNVLKEIIDESWIFLDIEKAPTIDACEMAISALSENKAEWIDDVKSEIDKAQEPYITNTAYDEGVRFGLMLAYQIVDRCKESEDI